MPGLFRKTGQYEENWLRKRLVISPPFDMSHADILRRHENECKSLGCPFPMKKLLA